MSIFVDGKKRLFLIRLRRIIYKSRTSAPYLSGDAFAQIAEYSPFGANGQDVPNLAKLRSSKSIFVPAHLLGNLVEGYSGSITATVLITGNSDRNFIEMPKLPSSVKYWLGQNLAIEKTGRLATMTIPIGLENLALGRAGLPRNFKNFNPKYLDSVLVPPMAPSNPIRMKIVDEIRGSSNSVLDLYIDYMSEKEYFNLVNDYNCST